MGTFHDLRKTAISNWFAEGLKEYEVMTLAGHADFKTTHKFYLAIADDLKDRARQATARGLCQNRRKRKRTSRCNYLPKNNLGMGRGGFEPPTHGFSVRCSTN